MINDQDNLEKHEILQIEDTIYCQYCHAYAKPGETFCVCGKVLVKLATLMLGKSLTTISRSCTRRGNTGKYGRHAGRNVGVSQESQEHRSPTNVVRRGDVTILVMHGI